MKRYLNKDSELFAAAVMQSKVEAWLEVATGVYCIEGSGVIERFTPETVKLRDQDGSVLHYFRYPNMFKT